MNSTCSFESFQTLLDHCLQPVASDSKGFETGFDYQKLNRDQNLKSLIEKQLIEISGFDPSCLTSKDEALAFWINCYNFFMIAKVSKQGFETKSRPIKSVKELGTFFKPFTAFSDLDFKVGNTLITLDQIEKETLLGEAYKAKNWKEARVHFAVNCASVSCPALNSKIYSPLNLNQKLDENVTHALQTRRHFYIDGNTIYLTELFKWYSQDFIDEQGSVLGFISKYNHDKVVIDLIQQTPDIKYIKYNWNLNTLENF